LQQLDGSSSYSAGLTTSTPHANNALMHSHEPAQRDVYTPQTGANRGSSSGVSSTGYMSTSYLAHDGANERAQYGAPISNSRSHQGGMASQYDHHMHDQYAPRSSGNASDTASNQWGVVAGGSWASGGGMHNDGTLRSA
jgi:hypothetical protein